MADPNTTSKGGSLGDLKHGLYLDLSRLQVPEDSPLGQYFKETVAGLLERFAEPAPALAVVIAHNLAFKIIRARSFMMAVLGSGQEPAPTADLNFLHLSGSMRSDVRELWQMSKDNRPVEPRPPEWLEHVKELAEAEEAENKDEAQE
jgi:hypothetical protein